MTYAIVIIGILAIIVVHELGHLLSAKATGIRATAFSLFFGPAIAKFTWKGTQWRIGTIPLGGYVRIPAILPPDFGNDVLLVEQSWNLSDASRQKLGYVKDSQGLYNFIHELPEDEKPKDWERFADEHASDTYHLASWWKRATVILAGSAVNISMGIVILWLSLWLYSPVYKTDWKITKVEGNTPKSLVGQKVLQLNDQNLQSSDLRQKVRDLPQKKGKSVLLLENDEIVYVDKGGATLELDKSTFVGRSDNVSSGEAFKNALIFTKGIVTGTLEVAAKAFYDEDVRKETGTVVGAVGAAPLAKDIMPQYLAIISIALGLVNLLPLLPLDGGHFLMTSLRALKVPLGRPAYYAFGAAGMMFVLALFAIGFRNDLQYF